MQYKPSDRKSRNCLPELEQEREPEAMPVQLVWSLLAFK